MSTRGRGEVVLGLSADYHDAAAAVVVGGCIVTAAEEQAFTRRKHDPSLPRHATAWCLESAGIGPGDLSRVVFYDKPMTTWERISATHARAGPKGFPAFREAASQWIGSKLWVGYRVAAMLRDLGFDAPATSFVEHHQSHAAAAFYPSPFERAAILTFDGVGEWATSTIAWGAGHRIEMKREQRFPDSLGLLYSAATAFCGFAVNDGEYKLMGLAPYGRPVYAELLRREVVHIHDDGSVRLDQRWFSYDAGRRMTHRRLDRLLDGPPRDPGDELGQREADIAASMQAILEEAVLKAARHAHEITGERAVCLAGGVALNCVANARLRADGPFDEVWVQPAAGDSGSAVGAALWAWHQLEGRPRSAPSGDGMRGAALGPSFTSDEVAAWLDEVGVAFERPDDLGNLCTVVSGYLARGEIVGWFRGPMEFGPRALGHRSILGDPRDPSVARRLNLAVKGREDFRPFAPAVLATQAEEWFDLGGVASPYMLFTASVRERYRKEPEGEEPTGFADRLARVRSSIPACSHVDHSARVQTVDARTSPVFHQLIERFHEETGVPMVLNTSFNRAGEPIVRSPADALRCAEVAGLDLLVIEDCIVRPQGAGDRSPASQESGSR